MCKSDFKLSKAKSGQGWHPESGSPEHALGAAGRQPAWADLCQEGSQDYGNSEEEQPMGRGLEDSQEEEALGLGVGKEEFLGYKGRERQSSTFVPGSQGRV